MLPLGRLGLENYLSGLLLATENALSGFAFAPRRVIFSGLCLRRREILFDYFYIFLSARESPEGPQARRRLRGRSKTGNNPAASDQRFLRRAISPRFAVRWQQKMRFLGSHLHPDA